MGSKLRLLLLLFALNLTVIFSMTVIRQAGPSRQMYLIAQADGLLLSGLNIYGYRAMAYFKDFASLENYLRNLGYEFPRLCDVCRSPVRDVELREEGNGIYKIYFRVAESTETRPLVIYVPDADSARVFYSYLRYQGLARSQLGFALPL